MQNNIIYEKAKEFKRKYPRTIAFRIKAHAKIAAKYIGTDEEVKYVFLGQKNSDSYDFINTNVVVLTDKRIIVATKRILFGYFFRTITPDMFNDLTVKSGIIWGKVIIDTIKEVVVLSNIDPNALTEIDDNINMYMIEEKKKYREKEKIEREITE
ncbi:MAG: PH domain-containing protein [Bacilli bacterium]